MLFVVNVSDFIHIRNKLYGFLNKKSSVAELPSANAKLA